MPGEERGRGNQVRKTDREREREREREGERERTIPKVRNSCVVDTIVYVCVRKVSRFTCKLYGDTKG